MSAGVCRQTLNSIRPNTQNSIIIGVIINSQNSKTFETVQSRGIRGVWTFTLRDSEKDFINVTAWGSVDFIDRLTSTFHIGSVVEIISAKVMLRKENDRNENFCPSVSSPYTLSVNEHSALIQSHDSPDKNRYKRLLRIPTKATSELRTLKSILDVIETLQNQYVNLLVVVTFVSESRDIITKDARSFVCRDFEVADGSTQKSVSFKLWDKEWVKLSEVWQPKDTVLFIADAFIGYDAYKKKSVISLVRKTLITENPDLPETIEVKKSINCEPDHLPSNPFLVPNPESVKTVMTIREISEKLNNMSIPEGERLQFVTILYAFVTEINMESIVNTGALITRCALCKRVVAEGNDSCMNLECPSGNGRREPMNVSNLYLKLNLKDDTGYLIGCRLTGPAAERALNCTASDFAKMTLPERGELKWKLCLEKCDVRLQVLGPTQTFPRALYNILAIKRIRDGEVVETDNEDDERFPPFE
ncbi:meiosis-specific with OB domain-containing protein [Venturia canescens]|uniref:meiosis-specific with OB domain-containing protein n=1 Tax=Venturia canescens TaxID=32260 RepID=UPI001C9C4B72|nr:meiosis-specific with OB domain-containing protein [Venturia canescens]